MTSLEILIKNLEFSLDDFALCIREESFNSLLDSPLWVDSLYKQYSRTHRISEEEVRQHYINQVPMKRGCTYEDVCNVLAFLVSDQSSYMTGQAINVTGGQEMH